MTIFWVLTIIFAMLVIAGVLVGIIDYFDNFFSVITIVLGSVFMIVFLVIAIMQPISLKSEQLRQTKEREQIEHQIANLTEDSDRIKLNEWILTYNDWINDINTKKEIYGWFSWYYGFDMTKHTIINLV